VPFAGLDAGLTRIVEGDAVAWPSPRWRNDPVGFARDALGIDLWSKQVELVESIRDHRNTTCRSGHKCGKTTALAVAALWFYCSFEDARVLMTAVKASQVDEAMWREVRRLVRCAKIPIDGQLGERANYGLRARDGRQIWGTTARDGEGLAGISSPNILILADEASGISDRFFEVLGSSLASDGGVARKCYISNPTRTTGEFYRSHTTNKALFNAIHISSEDTPNARRTGMFKGLAGPTWIAEKKAEYGEDSHAYRVRVKGEFVHDKDGKIVSLDAIAQAQLAWDEASDAGRMQIGVDPAGDGVLGDESAFAVRRGSKIVTVLAERGKTEEEVVAYVADLAATYRKNREPRPRVLVDAEGGIGTRVYTRLRFYADKHPDSFDVVAVRSSKKLWGSPEFDTVRDGLWGTVAKWIRAGGALPEDIKLGQELNAPSFVADKNQRYVATDKKTLRKELGRSPDRADAVCLAVWQYETDDAHESEDVAEASPADAVKAAPSSAAIDHDDVYDGQAVNPYDALGVWG
jgi:phage terminase large subunit